MTPRSISLGLLLGLAALAPALPPDENKAGAVVLVDTRSIEDSFASVDWFERMGLPFVVGVNCFAGSPIHAVEEVREALAVPSEVPVLLCDARDRESTKHTLIELVQHALVLAAS